MEEFKNLVKDMSVHAQKDYPNEACGIITSDFKYVPCKNLSTQPKDSFVVDPIALLEYENNAWGIFHSHPGDENPLPSEEDVKHTVFDEYRFLVGFAGNIFIYWFDKNLNMLKYEPFESRHLNAGNN